jgi:hypothetical protein
MKIKIKQIPDSLFNKKSNRYTRLPFYRSLFAYFIPVPMSTCMLPLGMSLMMFTVSEI